MSTSILAVRAPSDPFAVRFVRHAGLPVLLVGTITGIAVAIARDLPLGLASVAILFAALPALLVMERIAPFRGDWTPSVSEWRRDSVYFGVNALVSSLVNAGIGVAAILLARDATGWSLGIEIPVAYVVAGLVGYTTHRLGHEVGALWQLHGVHHATDKVNAWNNNVIHFLDLVFQNGASLIALLVIGCSPEAVFAVTCFNQVVGFNDHANADFRMGWLNYVVGTPEQHRLHHSVDLEEAGNYCAVPWIDMLFGTFTWRPEREPAEVGIVEPESFPSPDSIAANAVHPFRAWSGRARSDDEEAAR